MKITRTKILVASALLFMTASAQALQPEVLYGFQHEPRNPSAKLIEGSDGNFYGTTQSGGGGNGTVFRVTTNGVLATLASFTGSEAGLVLGYDGSFYGTTAYGGGDASSYGYGTVFKVTTNGVLTTLVSFADSNFANPNELVLGNDGNFYGTTAGSRGLFYASGGTVFRLTTNGVLTTLVSFNGTNGMQPQAGLVLGNDGNFYGTTAGLAFPFSSYPGTVFRLTTDGVLTTLASFDNGKNPLAELVLGRDGNFYGTTAYGGSGGLGTVFHVTTNGVLTTLLSFNGTNGANPQAALVLGSDGNFYGTTYGGGRGIGTVIRVTTNGVLTTLTSFIATNGAYPQSTLVLGNDSHFYGTTVNGGSSGEGTVFRVTTNGVLTSLVSFTGANGASPQAGLVLGRDGNFYGTTEWGGSSGTVFKVTTNGVLTSLVSFAGTNGSFPRAGLVSGTDGYFYGTTANGGPGGGGTIFRLVISAFSSVARHPSGSVLLTGSGPANGAYRLWASPDLSLPFLSWTLLTSASFDSNGDFSYTDTDAATNSSRFYQLSVP